MDSTEDAETIKGNLARQLGSIDSQFADEFADEISDANEIHYGVVESFAYFIGDKYNSVGSGYEHVVLAAMDVVEAALSRSRAEIHIMIQVVFAEPIFHNSPALFSWMVSRSKRLLRYELLSFQTIEHGYYILNAVHSVFLDDPPATLEEMTENSHFLQALADASVTVRNNNVLDAWGHPYSFRRWAFSVSDRRLHCIISLASLRNEGEDIEVRS